MYRVSGLSTRAVSGVDANETIQVAQEPYADAPNAGPANVAACRGSATKSKEQRCDIPGLVLVTSPAL